MKFVAIIVALVAFNCHAMGGKSPCDIIKELPWCDKEPTDPVEPPKPPVPGEQIQDPKYCTSFLFDNNETTTHRLLSDKVSQTDRDKFVQRLIGLRYNTISLQLISTKEPSVQYDASKKGFWRSELKKMRVDNKLKVVMWLRSDKAPSWSISQWKDYITVAVNDLDDLVDIWTAGIENDEYWSQAETKQIVDHFKSLTDKPVAVHTTPGTGKIQYAAPADMFFLQSGFGVSGSTIKSQLTEARRIFPTKDIMQSEYHKDGSSKEAAALCADGLSTGIPVGCMTGCAGRTKPVEPPPPPDTISCDPGGSKSNLIKPQSDNDKKLVLVLSCEYLKQFDSVTVKGEKGRDSTNYTELPNGRRYHWRFSKAGSSYGTTDIVATKKDGSKLCYKANMGVRKEGWKFESCGGGTTPPDTTKKLYETTDNSLTLRDDFLAATGRIDVLTNINETAPGQATSTVVTAVKNGNTWTIPKALSSYPRGNRPNTWRIRLTKTPPSDVTYHTSIMQTFIRETEIEQGKQKTYPPTTRQ